MWKSSIGVVDVPVVINLPLHLRRLARSEAMAAKSKGVEHPAILRYRPSQEYRQLNTLNA
jgi:hypothetical protein